MCEVSMNDTQINLDPT